jgi:endoglucanase
MFRALFASASVVGLMLAGSAAQAIELKRGVSTDIWVTWPDRTELISKAALADFPDWRSRTSKTEIAALHQSGFDFARLTIDPAVFLYKRKPEKTKILLAGMKKAIADLREGGLNVLIDLHAIPGDSALPPIGAYLDSDKHFNEYLSLVEEIGVAIADEDPDHVAFEPINEPSLNCAGESADGKEMQWPAMALRLHATARAAAPNLAIVMQGACSGTADGLVEMKPEKFNDTNLIWTFHTYDPHIFTHQGADWVSGVERFVDGVSYPPNPKEQKAVAERATRRIKDAGFAKAEEKLQIRRVNEALNTYYTSDRAEMMVLEPFDKVATWADANNVPASKILVGEIGAIRENQFGTIPNKMRGAYFADAIALPEDLGWGWAVLSWGGSFGIVESDENRKPFPELLKAMNLKPGM